MEIESIVNSVKSYDPNVNCDQILEAYNFSKKVHSKQKRASGSPYLEHPIQVAKLLTEIKLDVPSIATGLLHDTVEDTETTISDIKNKFGNEITHLVDGLTKINQISLKKNLNSESDNFRKLLLATSKDIRVILIKLADRLHNMRTLHHFDDMNKKYRIAFETQEVYVPLAQKLGIKEWQDELEDYSFQIINSDARNSIIERLNYLNKKDETIIDDIQNNLKNLLEKENIKSKVEGRLKKPYSIWLKIKNKNITFEQLSDIMAFRIILNSSHYCYQALGVIHKNFSMVPGRFKDFISVPKENGYRSLHTTIIGPKNKKIEIQIRSKAMHEIAEFGVAAHWKYKDPKEVKEKDSKEYNWLHNLIEIIDQVPTKDEINNYTRIQLFKDYVYVFSPKGDIYELPKNATSIDFAYAVHSEVGDSCIGTKINGKMQPLNMKLNNGDQIEIITSNESTPSPLWRRFAVTSRVRSRIKKFIRSQKRDEYITLGKEIINSSFENENLNFNENILKKSLNKFNVKNIEDLYEMLGSGTFTPTSVLKSIYPEFKINNSENKKNKKNKPILLKGLTPGMAYNLSRCCSPIPGDKIVGIITAGSGVLIHTIDCETLESLSNMPERWLDVSWEYDPKNSKFQVGRIKIIIINKPGSLGIVSTVIANNNGNISNIHFDNRNKDFYELSVDIEVRNSNHLKNIIAALRIEEVTSSIERIKG
ncbi:MAG: GTP pyrophosphokinase rsh [Alphaproteobacteria bacterium MarineAlpha5_Bin12]|nr:bifunctional (p)ppGpp synthetase/guanosine-3',5'-bis(diphosphate) 3'-pyrophosphohydrolase [Pelagibacteraceae bacterium]PPR41794.1 MAG: GTP pyrophosphokinase rsh [Alphaproteobacteria bacterium MarineAlpha5_Bin12]